MKKLMVKAVLAASLVLVAGCGKKEEKAASSDKTTEVKPADQPPVAPTAPSPSPTAPVEPGKLQDVAEVPAGVAKECIDARATYVKLHDCAKLDEGVRTKMVESWNRTVKSSLEQWDKASDDDKKIITDSCSKMIQGAAILIKDC